MNKHERFESDQGSIGERVESELGIHIENPEPLSGEELGDNSEVYTALHNGGKVFIKLLQDGRPFEMEQAAFNLFAKRGIPAPRVLGLLPASEQRKSIIIETAVPGKPIDRMQENIAIYEAAGKTLQDIHSIKLEGFGSLEITPQGVRGAMFSWRDNAELFKIDFASLEQRGFINGEERSKLEKAHEIAANVSLPEASFMHSDYSPHHVFSDGEKVTGVIDVAYCYAGDPHKDITNMQYFLNPAQLEAFNRGYGPLATDELIPVFALLTAANKVAYRADRGFTDRLESGLEMLKLRLKEVNL